MTNAMPNLPLREGFRRLSVAYFLGALVLLLITVPFVEEIENGELIEAALITVVLLSAVLAVGGRRRTLLVAASLVAPAVVGMWLNHLRPELLSRELTLAAGILFVAFVIVHLLAFILRAPQVDAQVLCAGIAIYLMMGILWAFAYSLVARLVPGAFAFTITPDPQRSMARFQSLYFSFCTQTTVAYGDILPVANVARMLVMVQATTGMFYVTMLIARLVALYSRNRASNGTVAPS